MLRGIALKVGATFAFALMAALIKAAAPIYPVSEIVFFRSVIAMATLACWLAWLGEWPSALRTTRPLGHIGRSLVGSCGMYGYFLSLAFLPLADATAFTFVSPLMIVPLASVVLGEAVGFARAAAAALGFAGVLVMLSGHLGAGAGGAPSGLGALVALVGASGTAIAMIQIRRLTESESTGAIVFYFSAVTAVLSLAPLIGAMAWPGHGVFAGLVATQRFVTPGAVDFAVLVAIGLLGGCGQIMLTQCYRYADASVIAGFDYVAMIWAATLGYLLFGEIPTTRVLVGAAIVMAAGAALLMWERAATAIRVQARGFGTSRGADARSIIRTP
jgi:drug/metabolite transporter (DMT)-like permease